jgi:uncharacterized repeat protein (TIGR02543 family)
MNVYYAIWIYCFLISKNRKSAGFKDTRRAKMQKKGNFRGFWIIFVLTAALICVVSASCSTDADGGGGTVQIPSVLRETTWTDADGNELAFTITGVTVKTAAGQSNSYAVKDSVTSGNIITLYFSENKSADYIIFNTATNIIVEVKIYGINETSGWEKDKPIVNPTTITYTVTQTGGTDNVTDSAGIVFTFSASVDSLNLTAADITVGGTAVKGTAALSGTGTTRTLAITVNAAGMAAVAIAKDGIETATKNVVVYKAGQAASEYWSITWDFNGGTAGTGAQHPTQIEKGTVLAKPSPDPTKDNSAFGGWYTDSGLTQAYNFNSPVTANLNLYAKWEAAGSSAHTHNWGSWVATELAGTEERVCGSNATHIEARLTGTGRFKFQLISGATAYSVSKGTSIAGTVRIPAYYRPSDENEWQPVTAIGDLAFSHCTSLSGIIIPASITSIEGGVFSYCSILTNITVDVNNPNYTGEGGILYNKAKTMLVAYPSASGNVTIPEGITEIGNSAFSGCISLASITIPASVMSIGNYAFSGCSNLASITIPAGVMSIGTQAFTFCTNITSITIPEGVTSIGNNAFPGWTTSQTIYIKGYANETEADAAWGDGGWRNHCNAVRKYWNGSEYQ